MKKPKKLKYPKKPKASSANATKENYLKRIAEIDKKFTSDTKTYNSEMKKKETLQNKIKNVKR